MSDLNEEIGNTENSHQNVKPIDITTEVSKGFLSYSMSVIKSRALPDVRDGLKPVHRRIIFTMHEGGYFYNKEYKKSARIVGDVMGKYHPHGDSAIYETLVRLAQPWELRHVLVDGQGNFGHRDGDNAAAMRYTESRMSKLAHEMVKDINDGTVSWSPNYDNTEIQPDVLPVRFPNLLVNGNSGIAVGMATRIPTHNLGECIDACVAYLENPDITLDEIMTILPGPDFPTKGVIFRGEDIKNAYATGRGSIRICGVANIEEKKNKFRIVIRELPYNVSSKDIITKLMELVETAKNTKNSTSNVFEGISNVEDVSSHGDINIVIELKKDVDPNIVLNAIKKQTSFMTTFPYNATVLNSRGKPVEMPLLEIIKEFVDFRKQIVRNRTIFNLNKTRDNLHKQIGLYAATNFIDVIVKLIRESRDVEHARTQLLNMAFPTEGDFARLLYEADPDTMEKIGDEKNFYLSLIQVQAILDMSLKKLTGLEREEIASYAKDLSKEINGYIEILNNTLLLDDIVKNEILTVKKEFADERLTIFKDDDSVLNDEDLIEKKDIVVTLTKSGYVKRTNLDSYKEQRRGGKGKNGMETKDDDFVINSIVCHTKTLLLFFTTKGYAHTIKAYKLIEGAPNAKGKPIINFIKLSPGETIADVIAMPEDEQVINDTSLIFVTDLGTIRRNNASDFANINKSGKIAIKLEDEFGNPKGSLIKVLLANDDNDVLIATKAGICVRSHVKDLRTIKSKNGMGVKAITLDNGNEVINASVLDHFKSSAQERDAYLSGGILKYKDELGEECFFELSNDRMEEMKKAEQFLLTITTLGFGKRTSSYEFRTTARGGKGVFAANISSVSGSMVDCFIVNEDDGLVLITDGGQTIRVRIRDIRISGRVTRGVRLFRLPADQKIVSVSKISMEDLGEENIVSPELNEIGE